MSTPGGSLRSTLLALWDLTVTPAATGLDNLVATLQGAPIVNPALRQPSAGIPGQSTPPPTSGPCAPGQTLMVWGGWAGLATYKATGRGITACVPNAVVNEYSTLGWLAA